MHFSRPIPIFRLPLQRVGLSLRSRFGGLLLGAALLVPGAQAQTAPAKHWDKVYGGTDLDELSAMVATPDGGYLLGGSSYSGISGTRTQSNQGKNDYWIVKINAAGTVQWDRRYGGSGVDNLRRILPTTDGGYLLVGISNSGISGDKTQTESGTRTELWVVKINARGDKLWEFTNGGGYTWSLGNVAESQFGGYLIAGANGLNKAVQITADGQLEWEAQYQGGSVEAVRRTADNGFLLAGSIGPGPLPNKSDPDRGGIDYWVLKINSIGQTEWNHSYGGPGRDELQTYQLTADGGFILGGTSESDIGGDKTQGRRGKKDLWLVKVDANGAVQWDRRFGGAEDDILKTLQVVPGGYIVGASSWSGISGDRTQSNRGYDDYWLLRLDTQGNLQWEQRYGGDSLDGLEAALVTADGSCLFGGWSGSWGGDKTQNNIGFINFWLVKTVPFLPLASAAAVRLSGVTAAPNPAHDVVTLTIPSTGSAARATVAIQDMLGRAVAQQSVQLSATGASVARLPVATLPAGMYMAQVLVAGQVVSSQRIVVE